MIEKIKEAIKNEILVISIYIILLVITVNSALILNYRNVIVDNSTVKEQILQANHGIEFMNKYVNLADLGLRGYIIDQDNKFLSPYNEAISSYKNNFEELRSVLIDQGFDISSMTTAENAVDRYMKLVQQMVQMCSLGEVDEAISILREDPGYDAWMIYSVFEREVLEFEGILSEQANERYKSMIIRMIVAQLILFFVGVPILIIAIISIKRGRKNRIKLYENLSASNKKYIFNPGNDYEMEDEEHVVENLISNLKKTTGFINSIAKGNYEISWDGLTAENSTMNTDNIAGELITMRDQMKKVRSEDEIRIWITQGLSNFAEIVRENQNDFKILAEKLIINIVKYLNAQQGGLFILNDENEHDQHLELMGCYAYDRIKSKEKRIEFGQGLVGQCYLEKETIYMTKVPQEFVNITSGLGDARPDCILIVPLRLNEKIEGVIEVASMKPLEAYKIEFVERLGETIASAITSVRTTENTQLLLERSQQQAEEMRAQEEEMRQNMEELQATQEQMQRKTEEVESLLKTTSENEEAIKSQNKIILEEKIALETEDAILSALMDVIPDRVTVKDKTGRYLKVSKSKYKSLQEKGFKDIIGKSDVDMFGKEHFEKSFKIEKDIMTNQQAVLNIEEKIEISTGVSIWGLTSRVPLHDKKGEIIGTLVVTRDITKEKECEDEIKLLKSKG